MNIERYLEPLPLISRFIYSTITFFLNFILLLLFFAWLEQQFNLGSLNEYVLVLILVIAGILSSIILVSDKILRRLSRSWKYTKIRNLQLLAKITSWVLLGCMLVISTIVQFYELPLWVSLLVIMSMDLFFYLPFLQGFISTTGEAILSLKTFLIQVEMDVESVDFKELLFGLKKVNKITKRYNLTISPNSQALAMTTSFFKNRPRTLEDINEIIKWLKNPVVDRNFNNFCNILKRYHKDSKTFEKVGIVNESYWTFERLVKVFGILIPLISAILTIVIPILMQQFT